MGRDRHILLIEGDETIRQVVEAVLAEEGYEITAAPDGGSALAQLASSAEHRPDAILLDLGRSIPEAAAFLARYRELPGPHAPVVVTGCQPAAALAAAAEELGAVGLLAKPFELATLLDVIRRSVGATERDTAANPGAMPGTAHNPRQAPAANRCHAQGDERTRCLRRLRDETTSVHAASARMQDELRRLLETEMTRPLTEGESRRARALRLECERLRLELQVLWREFEQLRSQPTNSSK